MGDGKLPEDIEVAEKLSDVLRGKPLPKARDHGAAASSRIC